MSKSEPLARDQSCDSKPTDSDHLSGNKILSDPLLESGSFIDPNIKRANRNGEVEHTGPSQEEPTEEQRGHPVAELSNAAAEPTPSRRPRRGPEEVATAGRPEWLPEDWGMNLRIRSSGATAGIIDRYYIDPVAGRRFRSKKEVLHFLETGSKRKKKPTPAADNMTTKSPGAYDKKKSVSKTKKPATFNFDFKNPPEKVSWFQTDASADRWSPSIGDGNLPESTKQEWAAVFDFMCHTARR